MKKVLECIYCENHMVYTEDKEMEKLGWLSFKCSCGNSVLEPNDKPSITEIDDNEVTIATNEQKYQSTLHRISDTTLAYDGCNTVESLKKLIDLSCPHTRDFSHELGHA
jgi:hypothetical protein